jgi:hypothetical protein
VIKVLKTISDVVMAAIVILVACLSLLIPIAVAWVVIHFVIKFW